MFSLERTRVSNRKGIEMNIHSHCAAFRNDFIGHKIIVIVLPRLNHRTIAVGIAWSPAGAQM